MNNCTCTDMCIYVLKEIVDAYRALIGSIFACYLDASKAFDHVNHSVLFEKLVRRGVPGYIVRILIFWYSNQQMCVKWGKMFSRCFNVTNGVRQGGILSPYLFSMYVDDLREQLNECKTGCKFNDLVILAHSAVGLSMLLKACEKFGVDHDVKFNAKKSAVMVFRSKTMKDLTSTT